MTIEIRAVTEENRADILALHVSESQALFIETAEECLQDAEDCRHYQPAGLYVDGELVGFAMYGWFPEYDEENKNGRVWLDRFFIDERYQGRGLGRLMLDALIHYLAQLYDCRRIYLSLFEDNVHALRLYQKFGFRFNEELDSNGEKVMVKELQSAV
ncbi:GNAT family N-acetyltransferase [Bacillus sp. 1021]|uniref:GNAT family N-acetyltransferase n=1 Tax=Bacillus TaxID=1386 RepID=UPI00165FFA0A|nr:MULTISPECIES: GNAT family N-acetyltransferase [Bacillus]MBD0408726.1 GNAT family N-acetyltransferase [Bacillus sp. 1021]MED0773303.1 GNAT family N-acetyltransferase [Bacillus siamensis]MED0775081.1 GNAT family N-acetyltransferase [Bacillus siamensis]MED0781126.1 GNAT family N-acetyltransferase [Bacillus siamensis]MED0834601.1 GNAT family N-acetyltransferase [Bacillus siamensis]